MKKMKYMYALLAIVLLVLAGCGPGGSNEILVGEVDPLTDSAAVYGAPQSDALKLAIEEINDAGGVTVDGEDYTFKLVDYDDKGDPNEAVSATQKLIDRDGVKYILGWAVSASAMAAADELGNKEDVLMLVGNAGAQSIVTQGYDNVFRTRPPAGYTGGPAGEFVADQGVKKLAVLGQLEDAIYAEYFEHFKESFEANGGEIVGEESFQLSERDMYTQLNKLMSKNPDAIFVPGSVEPAAFTFKQLRELSFEGDIYGFTGGTPEQFSEVLDDEQMNGIYDLRPLETTYAAMSDVGQEYVENFKEKYDVNPVPSAVNAYDQMYVLKTAIENANSLEVDDLIKEINEMEPPEEAALTYMTIDGKMYDPNGQAFTTNVAMQWEDGDWKFLEEMSTDAEEYSEFLTKESKK